MSLYTTSFHPEMIFLPNPPEADKSLPYVQKIILGILYICLWLFFSHALILKKIPIYGWTLFNFSLLSPKFSDCQVR